MNAPTVPPLFEIWHDGGFLVSEANGHQSRDEITLTGGAKVLAGTVLGQVTTNGVGLSVSLSEGAANTGNGSVSITSAPQADVTLPGVYTVTFTSATKFTVTGPGGLSLTGQSPGAEVSASGLGFVVTAGDTAFAKGDSFEILVGPAGTPGAWCAWDPAASDGSQHAAAILFGTRDATLADCAAVAITRAAEVNATELIWPPDATPEQIAGAGTQLQSVGILLR
ncbi:head decoration protein [Paraburkholderia adhaesiva]|uniref:head decoration protein n=1 Tax=Paraburkholderia adhaesiva TaxID=2883244 RepID=UPI001F310E71|nr:head decoration protein [Paraburkholderia adhaesiva]